MRVLGAVVAGLLLAMAADAQVVTVGAAAATSWEIQPDSRPDQDFVHNTTVTPAVFIGLPVGNDTLIRLCAIDLPHEQVVDGGVADARLRGITIGAAYLMHSPFGRTVLSGGLGSYKLDLEGGSATAGLESWDFGWNVGVGEWFPITRTSMVTLALDYHSTAHPGRPQALSIALGLAASF